MGSLGDPIWTENAVDSLLAHVLVGEPDSTSPEHALWDGGVVMASRTSNDLRAEDLLTAAPSDVALKRLCVLHIRLDLPEY
jgi:hypothetical protein